MSVVRIAAILGFLSVAIGAFGAHALKDSLTDYHKEVFQTAWNYHSLHTLVILCLPALNLTSGELRLAAGLFIAGILVFSGSLYLLAITDTRWLGAITPIGGTLFLLGWGYLVWKLPANSA
ncbi:MAG: DUF423 domain-containing protein [Bdellovibrionales bacterium]|nr:DUF423 domain-containing protein [Bdellovibrionales bacterium]